MIEAGASAYPRVIDWERFAQIAEDVGAYLMVDMAHYAGLIAGGVYPNPFYGKTFCNIYKLTSSVVPFAGKPFRILVG